MNDTPEQAQQAPTPVENPILRLVAKGVDLTLSIESSEDVEYAHKTLQRAAAHHNISLFDD